MLAGRPLQRRPAAAWRLPAAHHPPGAHWGGLLTGVALQQAALLAAQRAGQDHHRGALRRRYRRLQLRLVQVLQGATSMVCVCVRVCVCMRALIMGGRVWV